MSSILNKRQQARNERALQDLIKNVAGNDRCADCGTKNPGKPETRDWAYPRRTADDVVDYRMGELECMCP